MRWTPTEEGFGFATISIHWITAVLVIGLFFLGKYMTGLEYTHPWYHRAPHIHKSFGLIVFALLLLRSVWVLSVKRPAPVPMPPWERASASVVQKSFYFLLFGITISGYLIPTAGGRGIDVFNWFTVPAFVSGIEHQEDIAGNVHYILTYVIMFFIVLHTMGALKHHFIDRDETLLRMFGIKRKK